ncbi:MAG: SDR family oxidoreductase [Candidatus Lambdaproteobacteria bacterium]|nr:SDR family oxidoreductase [Candidatus Lambdaproteobacteria bacterium]
MELTDQVAVITGAGKGIGAATAKLFAEQGAHVIVADLDLESAQATAKGITAHGGRATAMLCDVTRRAQMDQVVDETVARLGKLDVMVNNAGIARDATAMNTTEDMWEGVIAVNLTGVFNGCRAAIRHMRQKGYGRILNTSSISSFGNFGQSTYSATKAGVTALTRTLAIECGRFGITVNAVAPGLIETPLSHTMAEVLRDQQVGRTPMKRIGYPYDIARAFLFLASPEASFITGHVLVVDGGQSLPNTMVRA